MLTGAPVILYGANADADRAFFNDVLEYPFAKHASPLTAVKAG